MCLQKTISGSECVNIIISYEEKNNNNNQTNYKYFSSFYKEFQQIFHTHSVQQQTQATMMEGLLTKMEMLQQASIEGGPNMLQTMQDLGEQLKEGKLFL